MFADVSDIVSIDRAIEVLAEVRASLSSPDDCADMLSSIGLMLREESGDQHRSQ